MGQPRVGRKARLKKLDPADPAAAAELFFRHGFVVLRNCFTPEATERMMAAWEAAEATARPGWEE